MQRKPTHREDRIVAWRCGDRRSLGHDLFQTDVEFRFPLVALAHHRSFAFRSLEIGVGTRCSEGVVGQAGGHEQEACQKDGRRSSPLACRHCRWNGCSVCCRPLFLWLLHRCWFRLIDSTRRVVKPALRVGFFMPDSIRQNYARKLWFKPRNGLGTSGRTHPPLSQLRWMA